MCPSELRAAAQRGHVQVQKHAILGAVIKLKGVISRVPRAHGKLRKMVNVLSITQRAQACVFTGTAGGAMHDAPWARWNLLPFMCSLMDSTLLLISSLVRVQ